MGKNGALASGRVGAVKGREQKRDPITGLFTRRCEAIHSVAPVGYVCPTCGATMGRRERLPVNDDAEGQAWLAYRDRRTRQARRVLTGWADRMRDVEDRELRRTYREPSDG